MVYIQYMTIKETAMQNTLEQVIKTFTDKAREKYNTDAYAAGYFSSWILQLGERDPKMRETIIRQLTITMEHYL